MLSYVTISAQTIRKPKLLPKTDTTKTINNNQSPGKTGINSDKPLKELYKIATFKPKDTGIYMALKEPKKEYSKYKILNSAIPEKSKNSMKKVSPVPSK